MNPWLKRPALLSGVLALTLIGCTTAPPDPVTPPPAADLPDPGLPDDALTALVHGEVNSPVYDALKDSLTLVSYDGSQKAADHDVLIFDGDAHDPAEYAQHPLVDEALGAGTWVLGVDLDEAHKRGSLGSRLGAAPRGASYSYLVRTEADAQGRPTVWIVDAPVDAEAPQRAGETTRTGPAAPSALGSEDAAAFADTITARLGGTVPLSSKLTAQQGDNFPDKLVYSTVHYTPQLEGIQLQAAKNKGTVQTASTDLTYTFRVFLNDLDFKSAFQVVTVAADITSIPADYGLYACWGCYKGWTSYGNPDEFAWFLTRHTTEMSPVAADRPLLSMIASAPAHSSADVDTYTSALEVPVAYMGQSEPFVYRNSVTNSLLNWRLNSNVLDPGVVASWEFASVYPWDADTNFDDGDNPGWNDDAYPLEPNYISKNRLDVYGQAAWKTAAVLDQKVSFSLKSEQHLAAVYCAENGQRNGCLSDKADFAEAPGLYQVFEIDLGAAARDNSIESLTFSPNPVDAATVTTGTITLTSEATVDITINLSSNSSNAVLLEDTVVIPKGAKTATFDVANNGGGSGQTTVVAITASSDLTGEKVSQLTLIN